MMKGRSLLSVITIYPLDTSELFPFNNKTILGV